MDRETVLKHSKAIRLENKVLSNFTELIVELCTIKGKPEHISVIIGLLNHPELGRQIIEKTLEYFEREYQIIFLEKVNEHKNIFGTISNNQIINIY